MMMTAAMPAEDVVKLVLLTEVGMTVLTICGFFLVRRWWRTSRLRQWYLDITYDPEKPEED